MNGIVVIVAGIGMVVLSVALFVVSLVYRRTAGKRIREELVGEYGE